MAEVDTSQNDVDNDDSGSEQKITIGDQEMTIAEAKELLEAGKSMNELKALYPKIDFKELPKGYTQATQKLAEYEKLNKKPEGELSDKEAARKKEIQDFFDDSDVQEHILKLVKQEKDALQEDLAFEKEMEKLEDEFNGKDGRPKFDRVEVLKYGHENKIFNPRTAYKEMHEKELDEWKLNNKLNKRPKPTFFDKRPGAGAKQPDAAAAPKTFREAREAALAQDE